MRSHRFINRKCRNSLKEKRIFIPPVRYKVQGVYCNHFLHPFVRLSVCPSVCLCRFVFGPGLFFLIWHCYTIFGTWVYHHETMCHVSSWSRYDSHTIFGTRVSPLENVSHIFMTTVWPWPLAWITKLYFHNEFVSGQDSLCFLTQAYQV